MITFSHINYLAAVVSAIIYFVIGYFWYGKMMFAESWSKEKGYKPDAAAKPLAGGMIARYGVMLVLQFIYVVGLAAVIILIGKPGIVNALKAALFVIILFDLPLNTDSLLFPPKPKLFFINWGYQIVGTLISAIILGAWR
jgi:hypothetical protein